MTPFRLLLNSSGLSIREAADFLDVRFNTIESWSSGRRSIPDGAVAQLLTLIDRQGRAAQEALSAIREGVAEHGVLPEEIEIGLSTDDHEARGLGWPTVSAHAAVLRRLIEIAPEDIRDRMVIVPRGSTLATAAAEL